MVLNNKGQMMFYTIMLSAVVILLTLAMTPVVKQFVDDARAPSTDNSVGMNCTAVMADGAASDFDKANCTITDIILPYFFFGMLAIAMIIVGAKVIIGGGL